MNSHGFWRSHSIGIRRGNYNENLFKSFNLIFYMVLDVIVKKSNDGYTAEIPTIKGCESWAHDEDTVLQKIVELASFYLNTKKERFKIDKSSVHFNTSVYKLIFNKSAG